MDLVIPFQLPSSLQSLPGGQLTSFMVVLFALALALDICLTLILKVLGLLVSRTKTSLDDRVLKAVGRYLPFISIATAVFVSFQLVYPGMAAVAGYGISDLYILAMLIIGGFLLSSVADAILVWYGIEIRPDKRKVREEHVFPFVRNVVKIAILLIFLVFLLQRTGFDTTAIVTGLGVGGIAVALALQDTLSNFFAGVHILVDKPFREEDYIKVEPAAGTPIEGIVKQIGWRTTRMLTPSMNEVVVPNAKLAGSTLENLSVPNESTGVFYTIGVDCREDVDRVGEIISRALHEAARKARCMDAQSIWVRFDSFGDYSLNFKFGYIVKGYVNRFDALKEVNRSLFYSFKKEGISVPFPAMVVYKPPEAANPRPRRPSGTA